VANIDAYEEQSDQSGVNIGQHYTLVKRIAYHLRTRLPSSIATDDLIQAGMEGLIHAQRAFEPSRGIEFELFAKTRIRGAMLGRSTPYFVLHALCNHYQARARPSHICVKQGAWSSTQERRGCRLPRQRHRYL
jgi:hypothetical protein